jgi:hypothetical protein
VRGAEQWVQNRIRGRRGGGPEAELALDGGFGREELLTCFLLSFSTRWELLELQRTSGSVPVPTSRSPTVKEILGRSPESRASWRKTRLETDRLDFLVLGCLVLGYLVSRHPSMSLLSLSAITLAKVRCCVLTAFG